MSSVVEASNDGALIPHRPTTATTFSRLLRCFVVGYPVRRLPLGLRLLGCMMRRLFMLGIVEGLEKGTKGGRFLLVLLMLLLMMLMLLMVLMRLMMLMLLVVFVLLLAWLVLQFFFFSIPGSGISMSAVGSRMGPRTTLLHCPGRLMGRLSYPIIPPAVRAFEPPDGERDDHESDGIGAERYDQPVPIRCGQSDPLAGRKRHGGDRRDSSSSSWRAWSGHFLILILSVS